MTEVLATFTEEQRQLVREGKLVIVEPIHYFDVVLSALQTSTLAIVMGIAERKKP